ncbi:MAG TPA: choice-of-anchor L domain-containing protein [Bacteroidota bacterium]|nr:choice-of-anchor L domain-containing protein [Bacteroidota bacterium]
MKKIHIHTLVTTMAVVLALATSTALAQEEGRIESPAPTGFSKAAATASGAATSVLTERAGCLLASGGASLVGNANQSMVYSSSLQGFPTYGSNYLVLSTGFASQTAGTAGTFVSNNMAGTSLAAGAPYSSPDLQTAFDVVTFSLTFNVPTNAGATLSFDWRFGSEENPTYTTEFTDFFRADVFDGSSNHLGNIALLPNASQVTTSSAAAYSNAPGGTSVVPTAPFPTPNDVVYNAMTGLYTSSIDVSAYAGQQVTIQFRIGDARDAVYNSAVFIDNVDLQVVPTLSVVLSPSMLWPPNHTLRTINASVTNNSGGCFTWELTSVTSNEPDNGDDDGNTINDIQGVDAGTEDTQFKVRAERSGIGTGRIYTATYTMFDAEGDSYTTTAVVTVPLSMGKDPIRLAALPGALMLDQNYPNPFNPSTTLRFTVPSDGMTRLAVYNSLGMEVARLVDGFVQAGSYSYQFDAAALAGGTYFYTLEHNGQVERRSMQLLK